MLPVGEDRRKSDMVDVELLSDIRGYRLAIKKKKKREKKRIFSFFNPFDSLHNFNSEEKLSLPEA